MIETPIKSDALDYEDIIARIQGIFSQSTPLEQKQFIKILEELSQKGYSETLDTLYLVDFKEVPVTIDRFLTDPEYLGGTNDCGNQIYPGWWDVYHEVFDSQKDIYEVILSGATRIGKSSTAVACMCYMTYLLMCYRNPQRYFGLKEISRATIAFANLTKELALSVAFREYNDTLLKSPWFCRHGKFTQSDTKPVFIPEGNQIEIMAASSGSQLLGRQLWCLRGDTKILTTDGIKYISDCANTYQPIIQYYNGKFIETSAQILETNQVTELIRVELDDGSVIEGTPEHLVMLSDGTYKALGDLSDTDDILTFNIDEVDEVNFLQEHAMVPTATNKKFVVYVHTSPSGKRYIGITSKRPQTRWGVDGRCYAANDHFWKAIRKYGWDNFKHEIVAQGLSISEACKMEQALIDKYDTMNPKCGYNHTTGGNIYFFDDVTKAKMSDHAWCRGLTKATDVRLAAIAEHAKNRIISDATKQKLSQSRKMQYDNGYSPIWINNGIVETTIQKGESLPDNFVLGRLNKLSIYVYRGIESKKIMPKDLPIYLADGWQRGRPLSVSSAIKKSIQKMHWEYEDQIFNTATELALYLNTHGYPNIVDSTITSLYLKGFDKSKKYASLQGKITKVLHEDKVN